MRTAKIEALAKPWRLWYGLPMRTRCLAMLLTLIPGGCGDNTSANSDSNGGSGGSTGACMLGFDGCPCTAEGLCLAGLACIDQQCVGGGASASASGSTPTSSDSASDSATSAATMTASTTQDGGTGSTGAASQSSATEATASSTGEQTGATSTTSGDGETSTGTTVGVSDSSSDTGSSSTGATGVCGDGVVDGDEACDGADLGGKTCADLGFQFGALGCTPDCAHSTAKCTNSAACGDGIIVQNVLCYQPIATISTYNSIASLGVGDMNNDGHLDVLGGSPTGGTRIYFGDGDGTFDTLPAKHFAAIKMRPDRILDLDKDGHRDVIGLLYGSNKIQISRGDGMGNLTATVDYDTLQTMYTTEFADVDGDGWLDMALCGNGTAKFIGFRRGQPNALFGPLVTYPVDPTFGGYTCGFVDFDGDGDLDLWSVVGAVGGSVFRLLKGDGKGNFTLDPALIKFPGGQFAHVADLNGDDYLDIVGFATKNVVGELNVRHGTADWLGDMLYSFAIEGITQLEGFTGNFDGNANLDVMVLSKGAIKLEVFRGDGTGLFNDGVTLLADVAISTAAVGDFNEDGLDDVVTTRTDNQGSAFAQQKVILSDP